MSISYSTLLRNCDVCSRQTVRLPFCPHFLCHYFYQNIYILRPKQISQTFSKIVFGENEFRRKFWISIEIILNLVLRVQLTIRQHFFQMMSWCSYRWQAIIWKIMVNFTHAYMYHSASIGCLVGFQLTSVIMVIVVQQKLVWMREVGYITFCGVVVHHTSKQRHGLTLVETGPGNWCPSEQLYLNMIQWYTLIGGMNGFNPRSSERWSIISN